MHGTIDTFQISSFSNLCCCCWWSKLFVIYRKSFTYTLRPLYTARQRRRIFRLVSSFAGGGWAVRVDWLHAWFVGTEVKGGSEAPTHIIISSMSRWINLGKVSQTDPCMLFSTVKSYFNKFIGKVVSKTSNSKSREYRKMFYFLMTLLWVNQLVLGLIALSQQMSSSKRKKKMMMMRFAISTINNFPPLKHPLNAELFILIYNIPQNRILTLLTLTPQEKVWEGHLLHCRHKSLLLNVPPFIGNLFMINDIQETFAWYFGSLLISRRNTLRWIKVPPSLFW